MIKHISLLGVLALFTACTSSGKETGSVDTADSDTDTDTDTDTDIAFELGGTDDGGNTDAAGVGGSCAKGTCIYRVTTTRGSGEVGVGIAETGDTESDPIWSENHTGFTLEVVNIDGSETYRLDLDWVMDANDQIDGSTTLLNEEVLGSTWEGRLTWMFWAMSADGTERDCLVTGHDTSYYASDCTQTGR